MITKNLEYLMAIIKTGNKPEPSAFKLMGRLIAEQNEFSAENTAKLIAAIESSDTKETVNIAADMDALKRLQETSLTYSEIAAAHKRIEELNIDNTNRIVASGGNKKKNLCLIHLESVSSLIYQNNLRLMPDINALMDESIVFDNYYSAATSTLMVLAAIMHGNDFETDRFEKYEDMLLENTYCENLFGMLRNAGYITKPFWHSNRNVENVTNAYKIWNDNATVYTSDYDYNSFISSIRSFVNENKHESFAMFVVNEITHCGIIDEQTSRASTFEDERELSYISLNNTVKNVVRALKDAGVYEDTVIVMYGDHGDDKWTRGINSGFSHFVPPYTSVVKCPVSIFDARLGAFSVSRLASSIDLKSIMLYLIGFGLDDEFPYCGKNLFTEKNEHVFSSSLFVNQSITENIGSYKMIKLNEFHNVELKDKSFSVINDGFCLLAGNGGVELYNIKSDYLCYNNLLNFFCFENGEPARFNNFGAWRGHFRREIMSDEQIYETLRNYYELKEALIERLRIKNRYLGDILKNPVDFGIFEKIRLRGPAIERQAGNEKNA